LNFILLLVILFFPPTFINLKADEHKQRPLMVLIPGSGSSGVYIEAGLANLFIDIFSSRDYFKRFKSELFDLDFEVLVCPRGNDRDMRTLKDRTESCKNTLIELFPNCLITKNPPIHILGHSMGGLIGRGLVDDPEISPCIRSLTTISSPHRGTPGADVVIQKKDTFLGKIAAIFGSSVDSKPYLYELVSKTDFEWHPKNKNVQIYSVTNSAPIPFQVPLIISQKVLESAMEDMNLSFGTYSILNDGVVPEGSMPIGTILGHVLADHWQSGCLPMTEKTRGCNDMVDLLIPHFKALYQTK
jgi:pimeloyl-ACP methyl ester carboxylesterase